MRWRLGRGGRDIQEGRDICIHIADSRHCIAENATILVRYSPSCHISCRQDLDETITF